MQKNVSPKSDSLGTLRGLLIHEMQDIYDAENQLIQALPRVAHAVSSPDLKVAIKSHLEQTRKHVQRVEQAFKLLEEKVKAKSCDGMKGLLEEGEKMMGEDGDESVIDAGIISAAQKVEHYEIAAYGCLATWAKSLGEDEVAALFYDTLEEEKAADEKLTQIADSAVNKMAA